MIIPNICKNKKCSKTTNQQIIQMQVIFELFSDTTSYKRVCFYKREPVRYAATTRNRSTTLCPPLRVWQYDHVVLTPEFGGREKVRTEVFMARMGVVFLENSG